MVMWVLEVLLILENRIEVCHALTGENADVSNHASNTSHGKCSATEPDQDDVISWHPVGCNEAVNFSDILQKDQPQHVSLHGIGQSPLKCLCPVIHP